MKKTKKKFKPEITRVRLSPEQAVLACTCYNTGRLLSSVTAPCRTATACNSSKGTASGMWLPSTSAS